MPYKILRNRSIPFGFKCFLSFGYFIMSFGLIEKTFVTDFTQCFFFPYIQASLFSISPQILIFVIYASEKMSERTATAHSNVNSGALVQFSQSIANQRTCGEFHRCSDAYERYFKMGSEAEGCPIGWAGSADILKSHAHERKILIRASFLPVQIVWF